MKPTIYHKPWYGEHEGHYDAKPPDPAKCAKPVTDAGGTRQCRFKRGYGLEKAFCKRHWKQMVEREAMKQHPTPDRKRDAAWRERTEFLS